MEFIESLVYILLIAFSSLLVPTALTVFMLLLYDLVIKRRHLSCKAVLKPVAAGITGLLILKIVLYLDPQMYGAVRIMLTLFAGACILVMPIYFRIRENYFR